VGKRTRLILLGVVVALCVGVGVAYFGISRSSGAESPEVHVVGAATLGPGADPIRTTQASSIESDELLFVSMIPDRTAGSLAVAPLSDPAGTRALSKLRCERVAYGGGRGVCLNRVGGEDAESEVEIFDSRFDVKREFELEGLPSRARVSADGRYAAITMFVPGEEDTDEGFSMETKILDLETGDEAVDFEQLRVTKGGRPFSTHDLQFSSVTFAAGSDHFYASLGSGTTGHLLEGSIGDRTLEVIADRVDSPSLSPDEKRVAFRRVVGGEGNWRLFVLDLGTMKARRLAGSEPIDDQAEWLDDRRVVYANDNKLWVVPADGSGKPEQLLSYAFSPAVSRSS
jgi:hypothetical protein